MHTTTDLFSAKPTRHKYHVFTTRTSHAGVNRHGGLATDPDVWDDVDDVEHESIVCTHWILEWPACPPRIALMVDWLLDSGMVNNSRKIVTRMVVELSVASRNLFDALKVQRDRVGVRACVVCKCKTTHTYMNRDLREG
eukprot:5345512-Pyramimonas_sp.AAC.1